MSSFEPRSVNATPWSLDEFAANDIFPVGVEQYVEEQAHVVDESALVSRLAEERAAAEAAAYARGVADAERAAVEAAERRVESALLALEDALNSIRIHEARWIANAEENVAALSVGVARHIVQHEVLADDATVQQLVQRAVNLFPLDQPLMVRLHPDDHAICASVGKDRKHDVLFSADTHIQRGGCLVEGRERIIDGRVDTALERLYRTIGQLQS